MELTHNTRNVLFLSTWQSGSGRDFLQFLDADIPENSTVCYAIHKVPSTTSMSPRLAPSMSPRLAPRLAPTLAPSMTPSMSPRLAPSMSPRLVPSMQLA